MTAQDTFKRSQPLYRQVKAHLVQRVLAGEWRPTDLMPSEVALAQEYNLSQGTVRKAIEEMVQEGLVSRHAGRGTFVTSHSGSYRPFRFHRLFSEDGERIASDDVDYVSLRPVELGERAARGLGLSPSAPATECLRLRHLQGAPVLVERILLPEQRCPGIAAQLEAERPGSIYLLLERRQNILITRVAEAVRARMPSDEERVLLASAEGVPVLEVERVAFGLNGDAVEWRIMVGNSDKLHYATRSE